MGFQSQVSLDSCSSAQQLLMQLNIPRFPQVLGNCHQPTIPHQEDACPHLIGQ